jgi:hypothetical protein
VTFSDARVAAFVNAHFVAAWHDRGPGFFNRDLSTERWIYDGSAESYPTRNICTFFLNPEGRVFHYAAGHHGPDLFLGILEAALELRRLHFDEAMRDRAGAAGAVQAFHEGQAARLRTEARRLGRAVEQAEDAWKALLENYVTPAYRGRSHRHTSACARSLSQGLDYLSLVHRRWAGIGELPGLEDVRYDYLWGNSFTEESRDSREIAGGDGDAEREASEREAATTWTSNDFLPRVRRNDPASLRGALGVPDLTAPSGPTGNR